MSYVMARQISGTRDSLDWPAPGQPVPSDVDDDELASLVGAGLARKAEPKRAKAAEPEAIPAEVGKVPEPETATARAPSTRRRRS